MLAAHRVGRCQLSRVTASPYQRALLERGLDRRHQHQHPDRGMEQSMGYTASVGAMILDEMVVVNEQAEGRLDALNTALVVVEDKIVAGQEWSERHVRAVREMEVNVGGLLASTTFMQGEQDWMRREMDRLLQLNIRMHEVIIELRVAVRHGRDNPIMIDNDEEEQEEGEVVDAAPGTPASLARTLVEGDHTLVEIVEGTPERDSRELSPEV